MLQEVNILEDNYVYYKYTWSIFEIVLIVFLGGTNMNCNLKRSKRIAIYGAGKIARYAYAQIVNAGYMPAYFIVSKKEDNPETLYGMAVREVNEVRDEIQDMQIVVGVSSKYKERFSGILSAPPRFYPCIQRQPMPCPWPQPYMGLRFVSPYRG